MGLIFDVLRKKGKKVNVAVTNRCNLKCKICNIWEQSFGQEPSLENYDKFFRRHDYWSWISFTGGEPFLRRDLSEIVKVSLKRCSGLHVISIPTNGFLTERIVQVVSEILEEDLESFYVSVSLDGLEDFHDWQRGVKGSFDRALSTFHALRKLNDRRFAVHFEYVISKLSQGNLMKTIESLGLEPNDFIIAIAQRSYFYHNVESVDVEPDRDVMKKEVQEFLKQYKVRSLPQIAQKVFLKYVLNEERVLCVGGTDSFYLDTQGNIHPCIILPNCLGDIYGFRRLNSRCEGRCYTPCEGYFSLLFGWRRSMWRI